MTTSSTTLAVTLCCSDEDLARVRPLAQTLRGEALDVSVCPGVDLDARALDRHMAEPRAPGVFVLCESLDLDAYQLPELEARFHKHKGEDDQLVRVNIEGNPEQNLEKIRSALAGLAGEEQTLTANLKKGDVSEELAEAYALARKLVEAQAAERKAAREAAAEAETEAASEDEPAAAPEVEPESESEARAAPGSPSRVLPGIAAVLGLLVVAGLGWFVWDKSKSGSGQPDAAAAAAAGPAKPAVEADEPPVAEAEPPVAEAEPPVAEAEPPVAEAEPAESSGPEPAEGPADESPLDEPPLAEDEAEASEDEASEDEPAPVQVASPEGEIRELGALLVAPASKELFVWRDASNHCRLNKRGGKGGWRLTSNKQLELLHEAGLLDDGEYWSTTLAVVGGTTNLVFGTSEGRSRGESKTEFQARAQCVIVRPGH